MMLRIQEIKLLTTIGITEEERATPRPLTVSLAIEFDHTKAVESDNIDNTFDYAVIESVIVAEMAQQKFHLIESVAEHIGRLIMANELVQEVVVEVTKPGVMRFAESVSIVHSFVRG